MSSSAIGIQRQKLCSIRDQCKSQKLHARTALLEKKTQCTHIWNRRNPLRGNKDQAQSFCSDLRVQGELDQSTDDEERKRSLTKSQTTEVLQFPGTGEFMESLFPKNNDNEYQDISQDAEKFKPTSKLMKFS